MKTIMRYSSLFMMGILLFSGCAFFRWRSAEIYSMSYDQTYQMALTALDDMNSWKISETNYQRGLIKIENSGYIRPTQYLTIVVKKIEPFRTKVQLQGRPATPFNQQFFRAIDKYYQNKPLTYPS